MKPTPYLKQILTEIAQHANAGRLQADGKTILQEGKFRPTKMSLRERALGEADKPEDKPEDKGDELDSALADLKGSEADKAPADAPAPKDAPADAAPKAPAPKAPAPADTASDTADTAEKEAQAKQAQADAAKADAAADKAKAEKAQAEKEVAEQGHVKLASVPGISFLLAKVLAPALRENTIDGLAQGFVDGLKIDDAQKFEVFKQETALFRKVKGFQQLIDSMANLVGAPTSADQAEG
jgi:hypothetical protein